VKVALIAGVIVSPADLAGPDPGVRRARPARQGKMRRGRIFPGAASPLSGTGSTPCHPSPGRSLRDLPGLTPGGVPNLIPARPGPELW